MANLFYVLLGVGPVIFPAALARFVRVDASARQ
jgi:hypothetical protein